MEMHQVRYFLAVSQTMNFTRAAEQCHVAQPSLTRAVKLLEEELGGDLFRRERKLTHLTEFGQRMLPFLRQCYESAQTAKTLAKTIRTGALAPLPIAIARSIEFSILTPVLTELARNFPGLELKFLRGGEAEVSAALKKGDVELAIAGSIAEKWDRLDFWPLFSEPLVVVVWQGHRLANLEAVELSALANERILVRPYCETSDRALRLIKSDATVSRSHEVACDDDVVKMIEAELGVGILPASAVCTSSLRKIAVRGASLDRTVHLYSVAGRERSAACAALMKLLRARDWAAAMAPATTL